MKARLQDFEINAQNVGGLTDLKLNIKEGLNVIEAPNAAGKTSLLRALLLLVTPTGKSEEYSHILHSGSPYGSVEVKDSAGNVFKRNIFRTPKGTKIEGDRLVDENLEPLVRRFAIGGYDNEILMAVRSGQNMKQLLMEYTNTDQLRAELNILEDRKKKLQKESEILDKKITDDHILQNDFKALNRELETLRARHDRIKEKQRELQGKDSTGKEYENAAQLLGETKGLISRLKSSISGLENQISMLELESGKHSENIDRAKREKKGNLDSIWKEIAAHNEEKNEFHSQVDTLNHFIDELEKQLKSSVRLCLDPEKQCGSILEKAFFDETILCPLCGQASQKSALEKHKKQLIKLRSEQLKNINRVDARISELKEAGEELKKLENDIRDYKKRMSLIHMELASLKTRHTQSQTQLKAAEEKKEQLEKLARELENQFETKSTEITGQFSEVNQAIGRLETEIKNVGKKLNANSLLQVEKANKQEELEAVEGKIISRRREIRNLEENIRANFNKILQQVYALLRFKNVDAIILDPNFELKISRTSREGAGYFDRESLKTLSTSELEVVGLVVMLSGYITYKVMEYYPVIVLDELTFLDHQRLNYLIEYISKHIKTVVLTTLSSEKIGNEVQRYRLNTPV
ncbi:archaea-specific SMC-related protein [Methanosarcina sp. Mfa9]|uniref:archaea-specific SMC-related protein n=1 Tax=Methanosarcina sp. Mfa9 TaxID=3439063 RepID=UPI003F86A60D